MPKNSLMSIKKRSELEKTLKDHDYTLNRQTGSHLIYTDNSGHSVSIPNSREVAPGTLRQILKTAELY